MRELLRIAGLYMENQYSDFEDVHRGATETIIQRLRFYLPYVLPLTEAYDEPKALDLGCGRGEWLELMLDSGIGAYGVDTDESMLSKVPGGCVVHKGDMRDYLREQDDCSFICVTCFHVVEHIDIAKIPDLIAEAKRVLLPGGLLIIETPNSENLTVGTDSFYTDPTHLKPVSKALLYFYLEESKFKNIKQIGINSVYSKDERPSLSKVLYGVSPDYAFIAQKDAPFEVLKLNHDVLKRDIGLSLASLTREFDEYMERRTVIPKNQFQQVSEELEHHRDKLSELCLTMNDSINRKIDILLSVIEAKNQEEKEDLERSVKSLESEVYRLKKEVEEKSECVSWLDDEWHQALRERDHYILASKALESRLSEQNQVVNNVYAQAQEYESRLVKVYSSWSWKLSYPLRLVGRIGGLVKSGLKRLLVGMISIALKNRLLTFLSNTLLIPFPHLKSRLVNLSKSSHEQVVHIPESGLSSEVNEDIAYFYSLSVKEESER